MIDQIPTINRTMQGIGVLAGTQRPFLSFLGKNWILVGIAGFAMYARGRERWKKGEFTTYNLMADAGLILSPLVGLALLNQLAQDQADRAAGVLAQSAAAMPTIDPNAVAAAAAGGTMPQVMATMPGGGT